MKLVFFIFFLSCGFIRVESDVGFEHKYIDLLPEADKQAFLDQIARRLWKEVNNKDTGNSNSHEIANDELDEHGEFVKNILDEESANLRRQRKSGKDKEESNDELKVKGMDEQKSENEHGYIDLTLRNAQRTRRFSVNSENLYNNDTLNKTYEIPVETLYDDDSYTKNNNKTNLVLSTTSKSMITSSESSHEIDIQVRGVRRIASQEMKEPGTFTKIVDFDPEENNSEKHHNENSEPQKNLTIESKEDNAITESNTNNFTVSIYESEENNSSNDTISDESEKETEAKIDQPAYRAANTDKNTTKTETATKKITTTSKKPTTYKITTNNIKTTIVDMTTVFTTAKSNHSVSQKRFVRDGMEKSTIKELSELKKIDQSQTYSDEEKTYDRNYPEEITSEKSINLNKEIKEEMTSMRNSTSTYILSSSDEPTIERKVTDSVTESGNSIDVYATQNTDLLTSTAEYVAENPPKNKHVKKFAEISGTTVQSSNVNTATITRAIPSQTNKENLTLNEEDVITTTAKPQTITAYPDSVTTANTVVTIFDKLISSNNTSSTEKNNVTVKEVEIFTNLVKALRNGLQFEFEKEDDEKSLLSKTKPVHNVHDRPKKYNVYEIPAETPAFVKENQVTQGKILPSREEPYYVPIYNYLPNNAYFNAYNRLGPNDNSINEDTQIREDISQYDDDYNISKDEHDKVLRKFKFNSKKSDKKAKTKNFDYKLKLPTVVTKPKFTKKYYNPDDYLDLDYFGRMGQPTNRCCNRKPKSKKKVLEESEEIVHPYDEMHFDTPKDHMSKVRQLLFEQQAFGLTARKPSTERPDDIIYHISASTTDNETDYIIVYPEIHLRNSVPDKHDISMDYYFSLYNKDDDEGSLRLLTNVKESNDIIRKKKPKNKAEHHKKDKTEKKSGTVKDIISMSDTREVFTNLDKLLKLHIPLQRTVDKDKLKLFLNVIEDMIKLDNKALEQYDWLGTTVDILAAVEKLTNLIKFQNGIKMHPADLELLKYIQYLYHTSKATTDDVYSLGPKKRLREIHQNNETEIRKEKRNKKENKPSLLPRKKSKIKSKSRNFLKTKGLIDRVWLYIRGRLVKKKKETQKQLDELQNFVDDIRDALYDLHNALKNIATITEFKKQKWFKNLKELYLENNSKQQHLEVLLHISAARLLNLIEDSARNGLEDGYLKYIKNNRKDVERSKEEVVFIIQVLDELKKLGD